MRLVKAGAVEKRKAFVRLDALEQLRDVGGRIEHVLSRYGRIVGDLAGGDGIVTELNSRLEHLNSQLTYVARRLQDVLVMEDSNRRAEQQAAAESCEDESLLRRVRS